MNPRCETRRHGRSGCVISRNCLAWLASTSIRGIRRREDEEDILQSMYKSFCIRLQHGDYAFKDRTDLWRLLVTMTLHKTRNVAVRQKRVRRDYRREQPAVLSDDSCLKPEEAFAWMEQAGPTPRKPLS